jgi:hypothetical protein
LKGKLMKRNNVYLSLILGAAISLHSTAVFANTEEEPQTETENSEYVPPAEASNGEGGWAVVDPNTGVVHGVTVCTIDVCGPNGSWGGKMPVEYQGCGNNCVLRFQSQSDGAGGVAGISAGTTWDGDTEKTFTTTSESHQGVTITKTLVPEKTYSRGNGFGDGYVDINTRAVVGEKEDNFVINFNDKEFYNYEDDSETSLLYTRDGKTIKIFDYIGRQQAVNNFQNDVEFFIKEQYPQKNEELAENEGSETVINEPDPAIEIIRNLASSVMDFFKNVFGMAPMVEVPEEATNEGEGQ